MAGVQTGKPVPLGGGAGTEWALGHARTTDVHTDLCHHVLALGPLQIPKHVLRHYMVAVDLAVV